MEGFDSHLIAGGYSEDFLNLDVEARIWKYDEKTGERIDDLSTDSEEEEGEEVRKMLVKPVMILLTRLARKANLVALIT